VAPILVSENAPATFPHGDLKDGDRITVGTVQIEVMATPGHSPDSICLCLFESSVPVALFSGDTLFAGDVPTKGAGCGHRASILFRCYLESKRESVYTHSRRLPRVQSIHGFYTISQHRLLFRPGLKQVQLDLIVAL
jgi:glyoxylase-like metal-dependent hydrolase (beta-lactamase superfamily II)